MKKENSQSLLRKYAQKLTLEGLLKALTLSLAVGFGAAFAAAAVGWYNGTNPLWLCLAILGGAMVLGVPIFYLAFFRSTLAGNAKRIDRLGLEERTVTMVEFEDDDAVISRLQREDARAHLATISEKLLKIRVPKSLWIPMTVAAGVCCAMTTVAILAALGYFLTGAELLDPLIPDPPVEYVYIEYIVDEGGYIDGEEFQEIVLGQDSMGVVAVADEGWVFVGWDDGATHPERTDYEVTKDMIMVAIFEPTGEEGGEPGNQPPMGPSDSETEVEGQPSDLPPSDQEVPSDQLMPPSENEAMEGSGAGGKYAPANQVVDGVTYYREVLQQYAEDIEEYLSSGEEIPEEIRKILEAYLEIIQ